jgi:hypothetical protein
LTRSTQQANNQKFRISAEVIADSLNPQGDRLTTFRVVFPKFILAEFNTHRMLSRSFSSSRAIPAKKMRSLVLSSPVIPTSFGGNQKGMQATGELVGWRWLTAKWTWLGARYPACVFHWLAEKLGLHKQVCNRLIEPWVWVEGVVSATEWDNFWLLRCHEDAQPEFHLLALLMRHALKDSAPKDLKEGEWHLPFIDADSQGEKAQMVSAARCARVSYFLKDGRRSDIDADLALCDRLSGSSPKHLSPFEHQAIALDSHQRCGNFVGWKQFRAGVENDPDIL